jgi:hypothetical protein
VSEDLEALEAIADTVRRLKPDGTRRSRNRYPHAFYNHGGRWAVANAGKNPPKVTLPRVKWIERDPLPDQKETT